MPNSNLTVEKVKRRIRESDPKLPESSESFKAALLILAATKLGHLDRGRLAEFTAMPTDLLDGFGERFVANAVWMPDGSVDRLWQRSPDGLDFWLLVSVATGDLVRERQGGEYKYRVTELGERKFKAMTQEAAH